MTGTPESLNPIIHNVTQAQITRYAKVSGDHNPLHLDEKFAATTPYGSTIAHGMLLLAFVSEVMTKAFGSAWLCGGKMKARFRAPVFPGDTVSTSGKLKSAIDAIAAYEIVIRNQHGVAVVTADTTVPILQPNGDSLVNVNP